MSYSSQIGHPFSFTHRSEKSLQDTDDRDGFHSHTCYEVYYFHEGQCTYLIGDRVYVLDPGDLILMHGMTLHKPNPVPDTPYIRTIIHFEPSMLGKYLQDSMATQLIQPFEELRNCRISLSGAERQEFESLLYQMDSMNRLQAGYGMERFILRLCDLLYMVANLCRTKVEEGKLRSDKEKHVQHILTYIEEHYMHEVEMDEISQGLHLNKHYLATLFKDMTGTTIFKYLSDRRINQARLLFWLNPERSVTEVSKQSGFKHLPHFSRIFKQTVGCTPEMYRGKMKER